MKTNAWLCLLLLVGTTLARVSITDTSPKGSPLVWLGTTTSITAKNTASIEILAYVARVKSVNAANIGSLNIRHDYYFKPAGVAAGGTVEAFDLTRVKPSFATADTINATTLYVQFVNGTEWGDHAVGLAWISTRNECKVLLSDLTAAYQQGGVGSVDAKLRQVVKSPDYGVMMKYNATHLSMLPSDPDRLAEINSRIVSAAKHDKALAGQH